jgi:hypothetical protein
MSQLTDMIHAHGPEKLAKELEANPEFAVMNLMWSGPEQLIPMCNAMQWQTVDDVVAWVGRVNAALGKPGTFVDLVDPVVTLDIKTLPVITWPKIHEALAMQLSLDTDLQIHHGDATYRLLTKQQWTELAAKCPSKRKKWVADLHDCDDHVKHFLGWLASKSLGNLAAGNVVTRHYVGSTPSGSHALVAVLDIEHKVWLIEPQSGLLFSPAEAVRLGSNFFANRMTVARVFF